MTSRNFLNVPKLGGLSNVSTFSGATRLDRKRCNRESDTCTLKFNIASSALERGNSVLGAVPCRLLRSSRLPWLFVKATTCLPAACPLEAKHLDVSGDERGK